MPKSIIIKLILFWFISSVQLNDLGYCEKSSETCQQYQEDNLIFYNVNPSEGFNLRRDVYMRFAIMLSEAQKNGKHQNWKLVLPPWYRLYHWKSDYTNSKPVPWSHFFNINSLKSFAPVTELNDVFSKAKSGVYEMDRLYVLQNYEDPFEDGVFKEKWEVNNICEYDDDFWGYHNVTAKETICVKFQGKVSNLWEILSLHPNDKKVMFAHGEVALHDKYGTREFWQCRKSMKFNKALISIAEKYIREQFDCITAKCTTYISMHLRRRDFARSRIKDVPSINYAVKQVDEFLKTSNMSIRKIYIATDGTTAEIKEVQNKLVKLNYKPYFFTPSNTESKEYKDGGIAIIDQIICSRSAYFIGTHDSTFTFRIQEEREILGFPSATTFNRFCPEFGPCEKASRWSIVE